MSSKLVVLLPVLCCASTLMLQNHYPHNLYGGVKLGDCCVVSIDGSAGSERTDGLRFGFVGCDGTHARNDIVDVETSVRGDFFPVISGWVE